MAIQRFVFFHFKHTTHRVWFPVFESGNHQEHREKTGFVNKTMQLDVVHVIFSLTLFLLRMEMANTS